MSYWTHINGTLWIDTDYFYNEETRKYKSVLEYVKEKISNAPSITGSDSNALVHVVSSDQIQSDWHKETSTLVVIFGNLRDRSKEQTIKEYRAFKDYIVKQTNAEIVLDRIIIEGDEKWQTYT